MGRRPVTTATGRRVCQDCNDRLIAAAAGVIIAEPGQEVPTAVGVSGWYARLRQRRGDRKRTGD